MSITDLKDNNNEEHNIITTDIGELIFLSLFNN